MKFIVNRESDLYGITDKPPKGCNEEGVNGEKLYTAEVETLEEFLDLLDSFKKDTTYKGKEYNLIYLEIKE